MIVSIDSGASYHKSYDGNQRLIEPSVAMEWNQRGTGKEIIVNDKRYLVGEQARTAVTQVIAAPHLERKFHGGLNQRVQHCYAFQQLELEGEHECLVQSLPYTDARRKDFVEDLKRRREFEWSSVDNGVERRHHVSFEHVEIVAQGVGAMTLYCDQNPGDKPQCLLLVDIGSCTTDVVLIQCSMSSSEPAYCHNACRSLEHINATTFLKDWTDLIRSDVRGLPLGKTFDFYRMLNMPVRARQGLDNAFGLRVDDEIVDCSDAFHRTRDRFSQTLIRSLQSVTGELWNEIDRIILTGGAEILVSDAHFDHRMRRSGIFSNVEGQHAMIAGEYEDVAASSVEEQGTAA